MYWDIIYRLLDYSRDLYSEPDIKWSKDRFKRRSYEIIAYETAINKCMDKPWSTHPLEVLLEYQTHLIFAEHYFKEKSKKRSKEYLYMRRVVDTLIDQI